MLRRRPMFLLFLAAWTIVHLRFEYGFWVHADARIFTKYAASSDEGMVDLGRRVYYTKATWMFALVWLQVLRLPLTSAMAWSFLLYSVELLLFFPFRTYSALNVALAAGMVIEDLIRRRWERT